MQTTSRGKCISIDRSLSAVGGCGKEIDTAKRKSPLRIEGDWSEYVSSKGLIYYYHCRTEVSQWQRPHEWTLPSMTEEEIKRKLLFKNKNGINNSVKRNCSIILPQDLSSSPKRIKFNNLQVNEENQVSYNNNNNNSNPNKNNAINCAKVTTQSCNNVISNNLKNKNTEANFNNEDMDISPSSSPMSRGSQSDEYDKKGSYFNFESVIFQLADMPDRNFEKIINENNGKFSATHVNAESSSYNRNISNLQNNNKYHNNGTTSISQLHLSLVSTLRSTLSLLQSRNTESKHEICLSVANISELLTKFELVLNSGGTVNSYRSHRLQTQLLHTSSYSNCQDPKVMGKLSANIYQIKELAKYVQGYIQDNFPNALPSLTPVSPNYSKPLKIQYYMQVLQNLVETCLLQLHPQCLTSPSSTSSPGSLKENNSTLSLSISMNSHLIADQNNKSLSPTTKEKTELDKSKSILCDPEMVKFVSFDISNTYKNQLADCYVQEAQNEYYKFVRLHSVLYPELACESKKLKALVRISEINTELFKHKKDDLEKLVHMLELRRLPNHLKCDYMPLPLNS